MIVDMRTYTYYPSTYRPFLKYYGETGFGITSKFLGYNLGLFTSSSTIVNRTMQWFAYKDHDHRDTCRKKYLSDGTKIDFTNEADKMIRQQESRVLIPVDFSPIRTIDEKHPLLTDKNCEHRFFEYTTYECFPGMLGDALDCIEKDLYPVAEKYAQWVIAYFKADSGVPAAFEMRAYSSLQERMIRTEKASHNTDYIDALKKLGKFVNRIETVIWEPMPMSPLR